MSQNYQPAIHLLLSDFDMPGMNGIALATQISVERPQIKVLLMSGFTEGMLVLTPADRIRVAPNTVAYVEKHNLVLEFAIPGAPTETIDVKMLEDGVYLTAPARDIEYAAALPFGWPVKPGKAEARYEHGLLRISVPLKDPMEGAVKLAIKSGGGEPVIDAAKNKTL